jgi:hypothetical protein
MSFNDSISQRISSSLSIILIALLAFLVGLIVTSCAKSLIVEIENSPSVLRENISEEYL